MHCKPLQTLVLCAALAVPAFAVGAPPMANTGAHPAVSAHTNALAGAAGAARIEACTSAANQLLDHLLAGDAAAATNNFSSKLQHALSAHDLGTFWQSIGSRFGKLVTRGLPQNLMHQGLIVISVPLDFAQGNLRVQFACGEGGKFAGLHFLPIPATPSAGL